MDISVVIPLYNEDESLPHLVNWIDQVMQKHLFTYEIILVNDGSSDTSWAVICQLHKDRPHVRGISFQRNYGKSAALFCGFEAAKGNVVFTMDADLQDSPEEIPAMYSMIVDENYDLVSGWKRKRYDPISKTIPSKLFNATARKATGIKLHDFNCGLKAYKAKVVKSIEVYGEMHRYIPVLAKQAGFSRIGEKEVEHRAREFGVTKFGLSRFINGYLDLLTVIFISKFGKSPMHFFGTVGSVMFMVGFMMAAFLGIYKLYCISADLKATLVTDNPYFYISLTSMILGTQLFTAGFLGELVSRNSTERNNYLVNERI